MLRSVTSSSMKVLRPLVFLALSIKFISLLLDQNHINSIKAEIMTGFLEDNETTATSSQSIVTLPPSEDSSTTIYDGALRFVLSRKNAYQEKDLSYRWKLRGVGHLYSHQNMVIQGEVPTNPAPGQNVIQLRNVLLANQQRDNNNNRNCHLLTIWVRVNGPELFAGSARPVMDDDLSSGGAAALCHWEFDFDLQIPGVYSVDARLLLWNGGAPVGGELGQTCNITKDDNIRNSLAAQKWPLHQGFQGFKLYNPDIGCCEICSRLRPYCIYWASPALVIANPSFAVNGCELYFDNDTPEEVIPQSHLLNHSLSTDHPLYHPPKQHRIRRRLGKISQFHGPPHPFPTSYFLGCGWSNMFTLEFPCLSGELEDQVYFQKSSFHFTTEGELAGVILKEQQGEGEGGKIELIQQQQQLPLCTLENEHMDKSRGRWTRELFETPDIKTQQCPNGTFHDPNFTKHFGITRFDGDHPHCWHMDDLSIIGKRCLEINCKLIPPKSKWISSLHQETDWFGVWRPYDCDHVEFTNTQLQQCIDQRKIASFQTKGVSISSMLNDYLQMRLEHINLFQNKTDPEARNVTLDTLALLQLAALPVQKLQAKLDEMPKVTSGQEHFWVSGFYLSSERETHATQARMDFFNKVLQEQLLPKGYKPIYAYDMTAAFTYDSATQFDGMHIIGPPMKMIITKLFHYLCAHVVDGNRL